jgi:thioesterase domain-containing protein
MPNGNIQESSMTPSRPSSDAARAAVWTGILGAAKHIGARAPVPMRQRPAVVQLRQGSSDTPLYFIGTGLSELHVAQLMPTEHSVYAVEIAWPAAWHDAAARNDTDATPVLEDRAAQYVAALRPHVGTAPCALAGHSFYANMAFEIAHQLNAIGSKVELVILLDAPAEYPAFYEIPWRNLRGVWMMPAFEEVTDRRASRSTASRLSISRSIAGWVLWRIARFWKHRFVELRDPGELTTKLDTLGRPIHRRLIERLYANSLRSYRLQRLDCRGVLFRADRAEDCPALNADHSLGWRDMFGKGLEIIQVTGDHTTMLREHPHDENLARLLSDAVARHCAKRAIRAPLIAPSA